ncbi:AAA-associated domain-containing protein [Pyrobaculum aerophilum]|uniref:AAA-associated domain-containing protein n=1 Tax=Pyrobaculum aerophilum TaxID=13773 RepID=UPI0023F3AB3A|nr:AAA-associated domain-containing protein [Pyrobaculum aerophilum]MCX8136718.1 AAA-associated domain-containing protein [Pyrobaculum aerophilum]
MRFPPVGVDQVLGLLKIIHNLGGRADAMYVNDAVDADMGDLSHVVDATEALGLVKAQGGDLELTAEGRLAVERPVREFQKRLRDKLGSLEPFASLLKFITEAGRVEFEEALKFIQSLGYDADSAKKIIDWAVFAQLVEIDDGNWVVPA